MKKTISYFSAMALTLAGGQLAFAQEEAQSDKPDWKKDFSVTIGVKVWVNEWEKNLFTAPPSFVVGGTDQLISIMNNRPDVQTSDIEPTPIPQLAVRYKWLLLSGSYYPETNFDFRPTITTTTFANASSRVTFATLEQTLRTDAERREWEVTLGILPYPNIAILGGYKEIKQDLRDTFTTTLLSGGATTPFTQTEGSTEILLRGPTIGIAASVPIARGFGLYANYAHGFMDVDIDQAAITTNSQTGAIIESSARPIDTDADYDVAEMGFTYTHDTKGMVPLLPLSAATVYAGYRWQHIETDFSDIPGAEDRTDTTRGFAAGLNLTW